jgi:hypothetical protein
MVNWRSRSAIHTASQIQDRDAKKQDFVPTAPVCCARAASGTTAAALPSNVMNSRRLVDPSRPTSVAYHIADAEDAIVERHRNIRCRMSELGRLSRPQNFATRPLKPNLGEPQPCDELAEATHRKSD